jgi:hypothetical protein
VTAIAVGSVRSGGATTLAMALAGVLDGAVLVEADADGGVLALRYGLSREPGLVSLAASRQPPSEVIADHAQRLPGGMAVVVGPESAERATQLLRSAGQRIAGLLSGAGEVDLVVDIGRLSPSSPGTALAAAAPLVLVVVRPRAEELVAAAERVAVLGERAGLVLVGSGPYSAAEVTSQLGCRVIGTVAHDQRGARALAEGGSSRALGRSALVRSVRTLAAALFNGRDPSVGDGGRPQRRRAGLPA